MQNKENSEEKLLKEIRSLHKNADRLKDFEREYKRIKDKFRESEARLKGILSSISDFVFTFNEDGVFTFYHSPPAKNLYLSPEKFLGKKHTEVMPPHLNELFSEAFNKNKKGEVAEYEYWLDINGKMEWFLAKLSPLYIDFEFAGSVAVVREITERKEAETKLKRYRDSLRDMVKRRTQALRTTNKQLLQEIAKHKQTSKILQDSEAKLREQKSMLEQKNIALREIVKQIEMEGERIKEDISTNMEVLVYPILGKLRAMKISQDMINILQHNLERISSSFGKKITHAELKLTPKEIEICNMLKSGLTSKEAAQHLNISYRTVEKHRRNIRKKLGITNQGINLVAYLREF